MTLLNFLKTSKNARKVFGKRELKIIEKQLLGVNLTQSEKNRLSRDIREKLNFIKKVSTFEDEFKLKKGAVIKELIEAAKQVILNDKLRNKIKRIFLFGSAVENQLTFRSDIDIAVEFDRISLVDATRFRARASGRVSDRIDIQVYNHLPKKILNEIKLKGRTLYAK